MADLIMTIDSDSDVETSKPAPQKKDKKGKPVKQEDEEILLGHSVILQDMDDGPKKIRKHTTGHIVGSNNLWSFSGSL